MPIPRNDQCNMHLDRLNKQIEFDKKILIHIKKIDILLT